MAQWCKENAVLRKPAALCLSCDRVLTFHKKSEKFGAR
jgi:hypothetical protein